MSTYRRMLQYLRPYVWPQGVLAIAFMLAFSLGPTVTRADEAVDFRLEQEMKDRHVEGPADLVQRVDGGARHAALDLADKAGSHAGAPGQLALAQAQFFAPGTNAVSE